MFWLPLFGFAFRPLGCLGCPGEDPAGVPTHAPEAAPAWLDFVDLDALKQHWNWAEVECQNPQYLIFVVIGMQTIELGLTNSYEIISIFADRFYIGSIDKSDIYFGAPKAWRLILDLRAATKQPRCECPE